MTMCSLCKHQSCSRISRECIECKGDNNFEPRDRHEVNSEVVDAPEAFNAEDILRDLDTVKNTSLNDVPDVLKSNAHFAGIVQLMCKTMEEFTKYGESVKEQIKACSQRDILKDHVKFPEVDIEEMRYMLRNCQSPRANDVDVQALFAVSELVIDGLDRLYDYLKCTKIK